MFKFIILCAVFIIVVFSYIKLSTSDSVGTAGATAGTNTNISHPTLSPLDELEGAPSANLSPEGDLAEIFSYGSDFTDLQRQLKFKEIKGKVVEWSLPVYEVKQSGDGYTIQTSSHAKGDPFGTKLIATFLRVLPRSEEDRRFVERLKTGDVVKVKGIIKDVTLRSLDIEPAIFIDDERLPKQLLDKAYGKYNKKLGCWHTIATDQNGEQKYCMKLGRIDKVQVGTVNRYYVLALGGIVDDEGKPSGSHANTGMVGAFVMEVQNGEQVNIASNSTIQMGASGEAPASWKFVKFGSADYWGWQTISGDCHFGECYDNYILLAPYGKSIRDLTGGAIGSLSSDRESTSISVNLAIDSSQSKSQVFPLMLTVTGEFNDQKMPIKNLIIPFDTKKWRYAMPKEWPPKKQEEWGN